MTRRTGRREESTRAAHQVRTALQGEGRGCMDAEHCKWKERERLSFMQVQP